MSSPYFSGGGAPTFGPPAGLAQMLAERDKELQEAADSIGNMAGAIGGGIVGGVQAVNTPGAFGGGGNTDGGAAAAAGIPDDAAPAAGPSGFSRFAQGFAMNYNNAYNGGGGGGSRFASMVGGGGGGGGGMSSGGMNFKQFAAMGKTADSFREAQRLGTPSVGDEQPKVMGYTDDEWKHIGTADKIASLNGYVQGQVQSEVGARLTQFAAAAKEREAEMLANRDAATVMKNYFNAPTPVGDTPEHRIAYAMSTLPPDSDAGRVLPRALDSISKFAQIAQSGGEDVMPRGFDVNGMRGVYSPKGGQFQLDPTMRAQADASGQEHVAKFKDDLRRQAAEAGLVQSPTVPGVFVDGTGKWHDYRNAFQKLGSDPEAAKQAQDHPGGIFGWVSDHFGSGGSGATAAAPAPAAPEAPALKTNEVVRITNTGRRAVYDAKTKQFLRYADQ